MPTLNENPAEIDPTRPEVRAVAEAMVRAQGTAAAGICRQIAAQAASEGDSDLARSFTEFAAEAGPITATLQRHRGAR